MSPAFKFETGIAGGFYVEHFRVVGPSVFSFSLDLFLVAMIVVGGLGSIWGLLLGAAVLMLADEGMRELSDYRNIGLGLLLAVFVIAWPNGLNGWLRQAGQVTIDSCTYPLLVDHSR